MLTRELEDTVIPDVIGDIILPQWIYPESFRLISLLEVCQEWRVYKGGTWKTLMVSDQR